MRSPKPSASAAARPRLVVAIGAGVSVLSSTLGLTGAEAAEWSVRPRASVSVEWNDNRRLVQSPQDDTFGAVARVSLEAIVLTPSSELAVIPELSTRHYSRNKELESDDQRLGMRVNHALSERASAGFIGDYRRTTSGQINFDSSPVDDDEIDDGGSAQLTRIEAGSRKRRIVAKPSFDYQATERLGLNLTYRYEDVMYSRGLELDRPLFDFLQHRLSGTASYALSAVSTLSAQTFVSRFEAPQDVIDTKTDSVGATLGYARRFSDTLEASVAGGVYQSYFDLPSGATGDDSDTGMLLDASLTKRFERSELTGSYARSLSPSSSGDLNQRDEVRARYRHRITESLRAQLDLRAARSESVSSTAGAGDDTTDNYRVQVRLEKRIDRNWRVAGEYRYLRRHEDNSGTAGSSNRDSNAVFLRLIYTGDKYSVSR